MNEDWKGKIIESSTGLQLKTTNLVNLDKVG